VRPGVSRVEVVDEIACAVIGRLFGARAARHQHAVIPNAVLQMPGRKIRGHGKASGLQRALERQLVGQHGHPDVAHVGEAVKGTHEVGRDLERIVLGSRVRRNLERIARTERMVVKGERPIVRVMGMLTGDERGRIHTGGARQVERIENGLFDKWDRGGQRGLGDHARETVVLGK
jgi:hypothetical protein